MVHDLASARELVELDPRGRSAVTSIERPIVLGPARVELEGVAPENRDYGVMLPYTPLAARALRARSAATCWS